LQPSAACIGDDAGPQRLGVAGEDAVGELLRLVRNERDVVAAEDDGDTAAVIFGGDLVGALGGVRLHGDGDEVGRVVEANRLDALVEVGDLHVVRSEPRQRGDGQRLHLPGAHVLLRALAPDLRRDEGDFHAESGSLHGSISHGIGR
jgi:hypothetical protein